VLIEKARGIGHFVAGERGKRVGRKLVGWAWNSPCWGSGSVEQWNSRGKKNALRLYIGPGGERFGTFYGIRRILSQNGVRAEMGLSEAGAVAEAGNLNCECNAQHTTLNAQLLNNPGNQKL
jgi:hypothetical protein